MVVLLNLHCIPSVLGQGKSDYARRAKLAIVHYVFECRVSDLFFGLLIRKIWGEMERSGFANELCTFRTCARNVGRCRHFPENKFKFHLRKKRFGQEFH